MFVVDDNDVAQRQLPSTARFQFAVDCDVPFLNGDFRLATCANQAGRLEKLIQSYRRHEFHFQGTIDSTIGLCRFNSATHCFGQRARRLSYA